MMRFSISLLLLLLASPTYAAEGHDHEDTHEHKEEAEQTTIDPTYAKEMKIETETASAGFVHQTVSLTGKITLDKNHVAQIRARFPGIVRDVKVNIGDKVKKGQVLATVESNESLQVYAVTSPLSGIILGRNTSIGDTAESEAMFVVADLTHLWAEFFIFSRDASMVQAGQTVRVKSLIDDTETEATLVNLLPTTENSSQTVVARVDIDNSNDAWRAGMNVRGDVILSRREVPVAIKTSALQRQGDNNVVYISHDKTYVMRKVEIGQSDREWTEILSGLQPGETYVSKNSFIVKADIAKSEAEHAH